MEDITYRLTVTIDFDRVTPPREKDVFETLKGTAFLIGGQLTRADLEAFDTRGVTSLLPVSPTAKFNVENNLEQS
jgi:hypothetical protein